MTISKGEQIINEEKINKRHVILVKPDDRLKTNKKKRNWEKKQKHLIQHTEKERQETETGIKKS